MGLSLERNSIFARDFRIIEPLSEGGMGAVYVAEQLSTGNQRALKLMHPQFVQDPALRTRFVQEARVGSKIESDHIVQVVAAGIDEDTGYPYLAMELLKGEDLASAVKRRGALPHDQVREIFAQLCHALAAAHDAGVVHRDLKPENIFLATSHREGAPFTVKVLDFGIAKVMAEAKTKLTAPLGTPLWMAPEQTETSQAIGPQTDVWALGLIAFRALTGRFYWSSGNVDGSTTATLMREILLEPIVPPSRRAMELSVAHLLPAGFDAWFDRCVNREVTMRFANGRDARVSLARILAPGAPSPTYPARPGFDPTQFAPAQGAYPPAQPQAYAPQPVQGYAPPSAQGYVPAQPYASVAQGYGVPQGYMPPPAPGYAPQQGYGPVPSQGYPQPSAQGYGPAPERISAPHPEPASFQQPPPGSDGFKTVLADGPPNWAAGGPSIPQNLGAGLPPGLAAAAHTGPTNERISAIGSGPQGGVVMGAAPVNSDQSSSTTRSQKKKSNTPILAITGGALVIAGVAVAAFVVSHVSASRARSRCESETATATTSNASELIDACERACAKTPGETCANHGELLQRFRAGESQKERDTAFTKACDAGVMRGCRLSAKQMELRDPKGASELYTKACDRGDGPSCAHFGVLLEQGAGVTRDRMRAASLYDKGCQGGDGLSCAYKAFMLGAGRGIKQDETKAAELLKGAMPGLSTSCDAGSTRECVALAATLLQGFGGKKDESKAAQLNQQACDAGDAAGCTNLGVQNLLGIGIFKDVGRGLALLQKGCDGGDMTGCANLGLLKAKSSFVVRQGVRGVTAFKLACSGIYTVGCAGWGATFATPRDVTADLSAAVSLSNQACEAGDLLACVNLGAFHRYGVGTTANRERASELFSRACLGGDAGGCGELGAMYRDGRGVPKDDRRALELHEQACDWGERDACAIAADMIGSGAGITKDPVRGAAMNKKLCDEQNVAMACHTYGMAMFNGVGVPKDVPSAIAMIRPGCEGKRDRLFPASCQAMGYIYETGGPGAADKDQSFKFYKMGCDAGHPSSCVSVARAYANGVGIPKNDAKVQELLVAGCNANDSESCDWLGYFQATGKAGFVGDGTKAEPSFKKACDDGYWPSCANLGLIHLYGIGRLPKDKAAATPQLKLACSHDVAAACKAIKDNAL